MTYTCQWSSNWQGRVELQFAALATNLPPDELLMLNDAMEPLAHRPTGGGK